MKQKNVVMVAIICISVLEAIALMKGINGTYFSIALAVIAGLAGWVIPSSLLRWKY